MFSEEILEKITASKGIKKAIPSRKKLSLGIKKVPIIIINKIPNFTLGSSLWTMLFLYIYCPNTILSFICLTPNNDII